MDPFRSTVRTDAQAPLPGRDPGPQPGASPSAGDAVPPALGIGAPAPVETSPVLQLSERAAERLAGPKPKEIPGDLWRTLAGFVGPVGSANLSSTQKQAAQALRKLPPIQGPYKDLKDALAERDKTQEALANASALPQDERNRLRDKLAALDRAVNTSSQAVTLAEMVSDLPAGVQVDGWVRFHQGTAPTFERFRQVAGSGMGSFERAPATAAELSRRLDKLVGAGLVAQALNLAAQVVRLNPAHPNAICSLIRALMHAGKLDEAACVANRLLDLAGLDSCSTESREILAILAARMGLASDMQALAGSAAAPLTPLKTSALNNDLDGVIRALVVERQSILGEDPITADMAHASLAAFASSNYADGIRDNPKWTKFLFSLGHSPALFQRSIPRRGFAEGFDPDFRFRDLAFPTGGIAEKGLPPERHFTCDRDWEMFGTVCRNLREPCERLLDVVNRDTRHLLYVHVLRPMLVDLGAESIYLKLDRASGHPDPSVLVEAVRAFRDDGELDRLAFGGFMSIQPLEMPEGWRG